MNPQRKAETSFKRRRQTVFEKAKQLTLLCPASVYILIKHEDMVYCWKSSDSPSWPPSEEQLRSMNVKEVEPTSKPIARRHDRTRTARQLQEGAPKSHESEDEAFEEDDLESPPPRLTLTPLKEAFGDATEDKYS
ncbi:MAG: hypothetical protein Q9165_008783 [Trypethelium subeluteriae]